MQPSPDFPPRNPDFKARVAQNFDRQVIAKTLGITLNKVAAGRVTLSMPFAPAFTQQHGFLHAGTVTTALDSACGYAAFSLMEAGAEVLTVELKMNLLAPAKGTRFIFEGMVLKPGKTLMVTEGRAYAEDAGQTRLIASMTGTMMVVRDKAGVIPT